MKKFYALLLAAVFIFAAGLSGAAWAASKADIVFLVDYSSSMSSKINGVNTNLTAFAKKLTDQNIDARFAVIKYETRADIMTTRDGNWTSNPDVLSDDALGIIRDQGGDENIKDAFNLMLTSLDFRSDASYFAFVLTDEDGRDGTNSTYYRDYYSDYYNNKEEFYKKFYSDDIKSLVDNKINTSFITTISSYTSSDCELAYQPIADATRGKLYNIRGDYSNLMINIAEDVEERIVEEEGGVLPTPETTTDGNGNIIPAVGLLITNGFIDASGSLDETAINRLFNNATPVELAAASEIAGALGISEYEVGNATEGYKAIGLKFSDDITLPSESTPFFVVTRKISTGTNNIGFGYVQPRRTGFERILAIKFNLLRDPSNTSNYMTVEAGMNDVAATDSTGETDGETGSTGDTAAAARAFNRMVFVTADGSTFALKTDEPVKLQGQTSYGAAVPAPSYTDTNPGSYSSNDTYSDGSSNSAEVLNITASGLPTRLSLSEDLTFTLSGVTVTDGKITGVRKTDGTDVNIYSLMIEMESHDINNVNINNRRAIYDYSIKSDGKVTISASVLTANLAGFIGNKTIQYYVDVDGVLNDDGETRKFDYWGTLGSIYISGRTAPAETVGDTRFEQVVSSQDLIGAYSNDIVELPTIELERVEITETMRATILEVFASRDIIASEILSPFDDNGSEIYDDPATFRNSDIDVIYPNSPLAALQILSVKKRGAYVFGASLAGVADPGTQLTSWAKVARNDSVSSAAKRSSSTINYAHALRSNGVKGSSIHSAAESSNSNALETMSTIYLNRDGKLISEVPEDQFVIIATCCNANTSKGLFIVENNELPWGIIDIIKPDEVSADHIEQIAMELSVDVGSVRFLASSDIMRVAPAEPTKAMRSFAAENKYQFAAKLDTIRVKEKGVYIFKVVVPEELKGIKTDRFELLGIDPAALEVVSSDSSGDVNISVLPPVFAGIGSALDWAAIFGDDYWVVGAVLPAAQPLSMYILRLLLILLGGCDMGAGLGILGLIAVCGGLAVFKIFRRK